MKGTTIDLEGYVIHLSDYKDSDCMVSFLTDSGIYSFQARGIKKPTSKNHILSALLTKANVTLLSDSSRLVLKESKLITYPSTGDNFLVTICLQFLNELNSRIMEDGRLLYPFLNFTLQHLIDSSSILTFCAIYFAQYLKSEGYGLNVDSCVFCGKKNDIVGVSLMNGGFVCRDDIEYESERKEPRFLKILRFCFRCESNDMARVKFENKECIQIISFLSTLYEESAGIKLKSLEYLRRAI